MKQTYSFVIANGITDGNEGKHARVDFFDLGEDRPQLFRCVRVTTYGWGVEATPSKRASRYRQVLQIGKLPVSEARAGMEAGQSFWGMDFGSSLVEDQKDLTEGEIEALALGLKAA